jgi:drug/metabolite transporter (DMT)-like permease
MSRHQSLVLTYVLLVISMMFFGMSFISTKIALGRFGPVTIVLLRVLVSGVLLWLFQKTRLGKPPVRVARSDLKWFLLVALFEPFLYFLSENFGLGMVSASVAAIIIGTIPVVTPVAAAFFLREPVRLRSLVGLMISFTGVLIVVLESRSSTENSPLGMALMGLAVLAAVGYTIAVRSLPARYGAVTIVRYQNLIGSLMFLPLFVIFEAGSFTGGPVPNEVWLHTAFLALFPSTLSYIFLSRGIRHIGATSANLFTNLIPISTALFSFFLLGESLTAAKILGIAIVITGVLVSEARRSSNAVPPGA